MELIFRPIGTWPGKLTSTRTRSRFLASYGKTLALLDAELLHLQARDVFLQVAPGRKTSASTADPDRATKPATHPASF